MATYTIDSVQDLIDLTLLSGKFAGVLWKDNTFNLTADLDLTGVDPQEDGKGWWPIGMWGPATFFNGSFDGQGHTISNMTINRPTLENAGFFGAIDVDANGASGAYDPVKNLQLTNIDVIGDTYVAGLIGNILGAGIAAGYSVNNCHVSGVIATGRVGGGIVAGSNNGYFLNCSSDVDITVTTSSGRAAVGGFIGYDTIGTDCVNCYSKGTVTHANPEDANGDTHLGGFVGEADGPPPGVPSDSSTNSFWDVTLGLATDGLYGNAVGKTTAQMKKEATYTNWDFDDIWWINEDSEYPQLRVFGGIYPTQATAPSPADEAIDVAIGISLSWLKDSGDNVLVYFDKKSEHDPPTTKVIDNADFLSYDPVSNLDESTIYVWRVDTKNENGTTTGVQWEFTTLAAEGTTVLKKGQVLGATQIKNSQIIGVDDSSDVCPNADECGKDCNLTNVSNDFHPGTKDSIINF